MTENVSNELRCPSPGYFQPISYDEHHCANCDHSKAVHVRSLREEETGGERLTDAEITAFEKAHVGFYGDFPTLQRICAQARLAPKPQVVGMPEEPRVYANAVCALDYKGYLAKWCDAVLKDDYDALRAQLAEARAENERLDKALHVACDLNDECAKELQTLRHYRIDTESELARLRSQPVDRSPAVSEKRAIVTCVALMQQAKAADGGATVPEQAAPED